MNHKIAARHAALHPPAPVPSLSPHTAVPSAPLINGDGSLIAPPLARGVNGSGLSARPIPPVSTVNNGSVKENAMSTEKEKEASRNSDVTAHNKQPAGTIQTSTSTSVPTATSASIPTTENNINININAPQLKTMKDIISLYYRCCQHDAAEENEDIERFKVPDSKVATRSQATSSATSTSSAMALGSAVVGSAAVHANGADTGEC